MPPTCPTSRSTRQRGTALLTVLLVIVFTAILGTIALVSTGRSLSNTRLRESTVGLSNCAIAVRQYIATVVANGASLTTLSFNLPGSSTPITIRGGHYENINVTSFRVGQGSAFGVKTSVSVENLANGMPMGLGSSQAQYTAAAVCTDADGKTYEVEVSYVQ